MEHKTQQTGIHQGLALCPSPVHEKVGINQKGINKK